MEAKRRWNKRPAKRCWKRSGGKRLRRFEPDYEEKIASLQSQCQKLSEELRQTKSEHQLFRSEIDQQLFQTKLELKTTQQLYNDGNQEKERFATALSEKEAEIKTMFQDLEEATKLSTFWEKECQDLKAANAQQIKRLQCELKEYGAIKQRLESEINAKADIIEKITKESLEQDRNKSNDELVEARKRIETERQKLSQTNSEKSQLQTVLYEIEKLRKELKESGATVHKLESEISKKTDMMFRLPL